MLVWFWLIGWLLLLLLFFFLLVKDQVIHILTVNTVQVRTAGGAGEMFCFVRKQWFLSAGLSETVFFFVTLLAGNNYLTDDLQPKAVKMWNLWTSYLLSQLQWAICGPQSFSYMHDGDLLNLPSKSMGCFQLCWERSDWGGWIGGGWKLPSMELIAGKLWIRVVNSIP